MNKIIGFVLVMVSGLGFGQTFLNGNFEITTATYDMINMSNSECNEKIRDVYSFGSYGDVDIIKSSAYGGSGAQDGTWYLAITGGGTDIVSLTLSQPLVQGKKYTISFFDRKVASYPASPIQIGLSEVNNAFGEVIHTTSETAVLNKWTERTFTFVAPNNGKYITVQMTQGGIQEWVNIDNFSFKNPKCDPAIFIQASAYNLEAGNSATLSVTGGANYTWESASTLNSSIGNVVVAKPASTTVYTVTSHQKGCEALTATVTIMVVKPVQKTYSDTLLKAIKKDTVIAVKRDTAHIINTHVPFKKRRFLGRKLDVQQKIEVTNNRVKVSVWDKNKVDGDEVAIYVNGVLVCEKVVVTKTKKDVFLDLMPGKNIIILHALNLGSVPPNTATLGINDGTKSKLVVLISDMKNSGVLEINYNPEGLTRN